MKPLKCPNMNISTVISVTGTVKYHEPPSIVRFFFFFFWGGGGAQDLAQDLGLLDEWRFCHLVFWHGRRQPTQKPQVLGFCP